MAFEPAIQTLVARVDDYLTSLDGHGISEVREGLARWRGGTLTPAEPQTLPPCGHLDEALQAVRAGGQPTLADAIAEARPFLNWMTYDVYPHEEIGEHFLKSHAFAPLVGEDGLLPAENFELGLFLMAPLVFYRDHQHAAAELYAPLTGPHGWRFGPGQEFVWKAAHEPVWNEPWVTHAIVTGNDPLLCIYGWLHDVKSPARIVPSADWVSIEASVRPL